MGYLLVENFSQGLDGRKSVITTPAGSLLQCKNAHITRGKEIEKRKKFSSIYNLPDGTFGLHAASNNLYVFGSKTLTSSQIPNGINYLKCNLPAPLASANMVDVIYSESFNGSPYIIAQFDNGKIGHFWNGVYVSAWDSYFSSAQAFDIAEYFSNKINEDSNYFSVTHAKNSSTISIYAKSINVPFTVTASVYNGAGGFPDHQTISVQNVISADANTYGSCDVVFGGPTEAYDKWVITINCQQYGYNSTFTVLTGSVQLSQSVKTFNNKMYSTTKSLLYFSAIGDPTSWGGTTNGQGFINITSQDGGSDNLTAVGVYQGRLAVFSRRNIQIWLMDPDPSKNVQSQTLSNIGTLAPKSVASYGDIDVFFLSDSGIRSLRARDASNSATVSDIGTAIDTIIQADMNNLPDSIKSSAFGIIEPTDGRYWLALNDKIYVFSYFPGSQVAAWSTYEPGFVISEMVYNKSRIYARSGNTIYIYGGVSGNEYDDCEVEITLPFLDGGKPATIKTINGFDVGCEGKWDIYAGMDISAPDVKEYCSSVTGSTFNGGNIFHFNSGSHIGVKLINNSNGYARLSNVAIHYTMAESN